MVVTRIKYCKNNVFTEKDTVNYKTILIAIFILEVKKYIKTAKKSASIIKHTVSAIIR